MNIQNKKIEKKQPEMPPKDVNKSRRSFAKGGIAVAPVIMSLASRPVWASRTCSYSGQLSGYISGPSFEDLCHGEGLSPGFWGNHTGQWNINFPTSKPFKDVFGDHVGFNNIPGGGFPHLIDVMNSSNVNQANPNIISKCSPANNNLNNMARQLAYQAVAALQNSASSLKYPITVADLISQVSTALSSCNAHTMEVLKTTLDGWNNQGGSL